MSHIEEGIEEGSDNVYADLGLPDADEMLIKAQLATKISEIIKAKRLNQPKRLKSWN